ncbi:MAG: hypothetical protein ACP5I4_17340 [Oceanipulchritudo sp.]
MEKTPNITTSRVLAGRPAAVLNSVPRVADLRFDSQKEREAKINSDAYARLLAEGFSAARDPQLDTFLDIGLVMPVVGDSAWVKALKRVRQRLRLSMPIHVVLLLQDELVSHSAIGIQHEAGIHLIVGQNFLEGASETELAYHFGVAIWKALDEVSFAYREILRRNCPITWALKQEILNWGRFSMYSAACYGLLACGDLDTAITETWRHCLGRQQSPLDATGLLTLSRRYAETGHMALIHLYQHYHASGLYLVGLPLVLDEFSRTTIYQSLVGGTGETSRTDFQKWVEQLDEKLYSLPNQLDFDFVKYLTVCSTLTRARVFEASPNFSLESLYDDLGEEIMEKSDFVASMSEMGFGPDGTVDSMELLQELKDNTFGWAIPLFCNEFIVGCLRIMARESMLNPECQTQLSDRLDSVLEFCGVDRGMADILMAVTAEQEETPA